MRIIEKHDEVQLAEFCKLADGLVHEDAASVHRRTDRIGRDKQDTQATAALFHRNDEDVPEMPAQRPAECFAYRKRRPTYALGRAI